MRTVVAIGFVIGIVTSASPARGDEIVGVLHLETEGVSETAAEKFETSIEEGLSGTGFKVAPRERLKELLSNSSYVEGCHFGPCLREVHRNTKVRLVLVARIVGLGPSYSFVVSLLDTTTGQPTSQVADLCDVCTLEEAIATATLSVIELVTGSGTATVDPDVGPTGEKEKTPKVDIAKVLKKRAANRRRLVRRTALFLLGAAVVAGGVGAYFLTNDDDSRGYLAVGAGGALAAASGTFLVISTRF
jgi:hypothetical protein